MRMMKQKLLCVALLVMLMLSLMTATALAKEKNQHFSNDNWEGTLSNLDWGQIALSVDGPSLDWDHPYWKWWIFKIPSVYLGVTLKIGCSGDFDVTIKDANLKDTVNVDTKISSDASEIFLSGKQMYRHKMTSDNLLDYLPKLPLLSGSIEGDFVAAATAPVKASGHFNNVVKLTLSTRDGAEKKEDRTFNLTSVEPTEPNKDVVFFIGSEFNETVSVLSVNLKVVTLGPLLSTNINMMAGANTAARKDKDLVDIETVLTSSDPSFHACVVKEDPGCVKGTENDIAAEIVTLRINIGGHIFGKDRSIFDHTWTLSKDYRLIHGNRQFIKSLTFNEPFKYQVNCDHKYYRVPVKVVKKTDTGGELPVPGSSLSVTPSFRHSDRLVANRITGEDGKTVIYLPDQGTTVAAHHRDGDAIYSGYAQANPRDIRSNKEVKIILSHDSDQKKTIQVRKKWEIDLEDLDRPDSVMVVIEKRNNGTKRWDIYEYEESGKKRLAVGILTKNDWIWEKSGLPMFSDGQRNDYRVREVADGVTYSDTEYEGLTEEQKTAKRKQIREKIIYDAFDYLDSGGEDPAPLTTNTVTYPVKAYTTLTGEYVPAHTTKYDVEYNGPVPYNSSDDELWTVTNTAVYDAEISKRFIVPAGEALPSEVYLSLLAKPKDGWSEAADRKGIFTGQLLVSSPRAGGMTILELEDAHVLNGQPIAGFERLSLAVGRAHSGNDYKVRFTVDKYQNGIPMDFFCTEFNTDDLHWMFFKRYHVDVYADVYSDNDFTVIQGGAYPLLGNDTLLVGNVINVYSEDEDARYIGGTKYWVNPPDSELQKIDHILIHIKDETGTEIQGSPVKVRREDNLKTNPDGSTEVMNAWVWACKIPEGNHTYTITEEFPAEYTEGDSWFPLVIRNDVINIWTGTAPRKVRIQKFFDSFFDEDYIIDSTVPFIIRLVSNETEKYTLSLSKSDISLGKRSGDFEDSGRWTDLLGYTLTETIDDANRSFFVPVRSTPVLIFENGTPILVFAVTNRYQLNYKFKVQKSWKPEGSAPSGSLKVTIKESTGSASGTEFQLDPPWQKTETSFTHPRLDANGIPYLYFPVEELEGFQLSWSSTEDIPILSKLNERILTFSLTNEKKTDNPDFVTFTVTKNWKEEGKKELRPGKVRYSVIGIDDLDNYHYMDTREVSRVASKPDRETITFTGLPRLDPYGVAYSYFVLENDVPGYTAAYRDPPVQDTNGNWTQTIENTLTGDCEITLQKILTNKIDTDPSETFTFQFDPPTAEQGNNYPMPIEWIQATETGGKLKIQDAGELTLHFPINRAGTYYYRLRETEGNVEKLTYDTTPRMLFIEAEWNAGKLTYTSGVKLCDSGDPFDKNQDHYVKTDKVVFNNIYEARKDIPVEKKWDIDLERKDKPNEIWVVLQSMRHNMVSRYFENVNNQLMWKTERVLKLDASNNWQGKFEGMPVYDVDAEGNLHEIQYRVRELREGEDNPAPATLPNTRIVHAKEDTDQITVQYLKKMGIIEVNEAWQFILNELAGRIIPEDFVYESPMVVYTVPAYQTIRGEREEEHQTKYDVKYETAEGLTRITNTAILETNIYKRWINFKDGEKPDSVYLTLMGRVREEYRELVPPELKNLAGTYIPVINPLTHGMTLLDIIGIRIPEGLDAGIPSLSLAIAKAKDDSSFLKAWHVDFKIKKYSLFGLPMEYEGAELSSGILKSLVKAITGLDFPISISLPGGYVSIPGKAYCIPILDRDWELTSNVFNIKGNIDPDPTPTPSPTPTPTPSGQPVPPTLPPPTLPPVPTFSPPTPTNTPTASPDRTPTPTPKNRTIVGVKYWINDKAENRPEWIKIHVFKGAVEIQGSPVELKKSSFNFGTENSPMWPWAIVTKDAGPDSAYRIEEEFPEGYDQYQHYRRVKNGLDLYNIWLNPEKTPEVQVRKVWEGTAPGTNAAATVKMEYGQGSTLTFNLNKQNNYVQATPKPTDMNIDQVRITETTYSGVDDKKYVPSYSGPSLSIRTDGTPVYTFTVTNHLRENLKIVVEKEWKGDRTAQRPRNLGVRIIRRAPDGTVTKIPFDLTENYLVPGSENRWRRESTPEEGEQFPAVDNQGKRYNYSIEEDEVPGYRMRVRFSQDGNTLTFYLENTWIPVEETVTVQGEKFWVDDEDAFGIRPETIQIVVMNSRYEQVRTMIIPSDQARWHVPNLPRYDENGTELKYFVLEGECENYTTTYPTPTFDEATRTWTCDVYNAFVARKKVTVDKSWSPVGIEHPQSLAVYLYAGDRIRESVYLTPANHWRKVFDDLPVMDGSGSEIAYRIEEDTPEGYTESSYSEYEDLDEHFYLENAKEQNGILAIPVEKMVVGGIPPSGEKEVFKIKMTFLGGSKENPAEVPMPVSDTVEITNKGMANFLLPYSEKHADGLYMYSLQEIPGNNKNYHYDSRVALVMVLIVKNDAGIIEAHWFVDIDDPNAPDKIRFINSSKQRLYTITYDPNGGMIEGEPKPLSRKYPLGTLIRIHDAAVWDPYTFDYWKGSRYNPGDRYTVVGDHLFVAQWISPFVNPFTFTKRWNGEPGPEPAFKVFNLDGTPANVTFPAPQKVDSHLWQYRKWFIEKPAYYVVEEVPAGYYASYQNVGRYEGITDRCYNGGTITNHQIPPTGDRSNVLLWLGLALGSCGILCLFWVRNKRKNHR